jgi:hypothetical protein
MRGTRLARLSAMLFGVSQLHAACAYSPPPLISQGQGADTLGRGRVTAGVEGGFGTSASWWAARGLADPEVSDGLVGAARLRLGLFEDLDVGLVGALGPEKTLLLGPEVKWRFAEMIATREQGKPGFHAALIAGLGVGSTEFRYGGVAGSAPRHVYLAPYQGITASGGIELIQMYTGVRLAESETLGNGVADLTLYPVLEFGVELRPVEALAIFAETDLAGGFTTADYHDSGVLFYPSAGVSLRFDLFVSKAAPDPP